MSLANSYAARVVHFARTGELYTFSNRSWAWERVPESENLALFLYDVNRALEVLHRKQASSAEELCALLPPVASRFGYPPVPLAEARYLEISGYQTVLGGLTDLFDEPKRLGRCACGAWFFKLRRHDAKTCDRCRIYPADPTVRAEVQRKAREKMKKARLEAKERKARQDKHSTPPHAP